MSYAYFCDTVAAASPLQLRSVDRYTIPASTTASLGNVYLTISLIGRVVNMESSKHGSRITPQSIEKKLRRRRECERA